jgi:CBS domain-containing protein
MRTLYVRDVMSSPVITIPPHTRLPAIKLVMKHKRVHRLPVVDGNRLVGIITLGDVRNAFPSDAPIVGAVESTYLLMSVRAEAVMRTDVITIAHDAPLAQAAQLFLRHRISGLPVLDGDRLVGIITKSDLCRVIAGDIALDSAMLPRTLGARV